MHIVKMNLQVQQVIIMEVFNVIKDAQLYPYPNIVCGVHDS
jgi:hypothetical protein